MKAMINGIRNAAIAGRHIPIQTAISAVLCKNRGNAVFDQIGVSVGCTVVSTGEVVF